MNPDFAALRTKMVDGQVRTTDVTDSAILDAMLAVPREEFVPAKLRPLAYIDEDVEIAPASSSGGARYLMEASPFAKLLQLAEIRADDVVLDVGCGSGYSSAVLSRLAGSVIALEENATLAERAQSTLDRLGYHTVAVVQGALAAGHEPEAPYDVIVIEGGVETVPEPLLDQLKEGGRLVAVEGAGNAGIAKVYLKIDGLTSARRAFNAAVKPLPGFERTPEFEF
ncbi:protein-L-isoaspartate O-methyltransferase family protein [Arvimicrobium flavum]|uniref:protein-L-isoaspartate O-methyltransferase family protein n=1 Tax=Arvimicrobium flavum TaxID=3393320 RepID=UPI00237C1B87|nr:protein-L-isoaspartate O-methyltransferase [Mesorhizobium shangrilense]